MLNAKEAEIFDLLAATRWALRYGTDAAISVLRVDSIMYEALLCSSVRWYRGSALTSSPARSMSRQAGGPAPPKQSAHWDEVRCPLLFAIGPELTAETVSQ